MRLRKWNASHRTTLAAFFLLLTTGLTAGSAQTWVPGDVFVGVNVDGYYYVYSNQGVYKGFIRNPNRPPDTGGSSYGCAFTKDLSRLYTLNGLYDVVDVYAGTGTTHSLVKSIDTSFAGVQNQSIVFDQAGDYYVGHDDTTLHPPEAGIVEYDKNDQFLKTYYPPDEGRYYTRSGWIDLSSDQTTLYFTNDYLFLERYSLSSDTLDPQFVGLPDFAMGFRLLPPFDGSGGFLVAASSVLLRLDQHGSVVQTYKATNRPYSSSWSDVALDPNGKSFWAADNYSSNILRFNIASGAIEIGPISLPESSNGNSPPNGLCVRGGGPDTTPPSVTFSEAIEGPPKQVLLKSYDGGSGLESIVVNHCNNCTAATGAFTSGTNDIITTTATKIDQSKSSSIEITATDVAGNKTTFDPVDLTLESEGYPTIHTIRILPSENILVITNGTPGLSEIELMVNGQVLPDVKLRDRETRTIELSEYMRKTEKSDVRMRAKGKEHATAWLVFTEP